MQNFFIALFLLTFLFCKTYTQKPSELKSKNFQEDIQYLEKWIQNQAQEYKIVGLSLTVVTNKEVLWTYTYGYQDKEKKIKISSYSNFQIGSIAKVIHAIGILKLVQEQRLKLDDPIHKYTNDLPLNYDVQNPITIRQLLTHHSGLPSDLFRYLWNNEYLELSEITKEINQLYLSNKPNEIFNYSNLGVTLSGRIIEVITKKPYREYIREILNELNMYDTETNSYQVKNFVKAYQAGVIGNELLNEPPIIMIPAGGFYSNADDMAKLMKILLNQGKLNQKQILKKELVNEMFKKQNNSFLDDEFKIGLPFLLNSLNFNTKTQANHGGNTIGYHSMMILLPDVPLGIIVMTNTTTGSLIASDIAQEVLTIFAKYKFNITKTHFNYLPLKDITYKKEEIVGYYNTSYGAITIINSSNKSKNFDCVYLDFSCELIWNSGYYEFRLKLLGFMRIDIFRGIKFLFKKKNEHIILYMMNGDSTLPIGSKITKQDFDFYNTVYKNYIDLWESRIGEYYNIKDNHLFFYINKIEFLKEDSLFIIKIYNNFNPLPVKYFVIPINENTIRIFGYGRNLGEILRFNGKEISYSGFTLTKKD